MPGHARDDTGKGNGGRRDGDGKPPREKRAIMAIKASKTEL